MNIYYLNHLNEKLDLDSENIILQYQELFNYSWDVNTDNNKISSFSRETATISITVTVTADTEEEYTDILHNFHNVIETDIISCIPGRLYIGDQYLTCYISGDIKQDAFMGVPIQVKNLTVMTDAPFWVRESMFSFQSGGVLSSNNKRYPGGYPYRYANGLGSTYVVNPHFTDANFLLTVYGPATNPMITIGGNSYLVNIILEEGERLEIDSREETITKVLLFGEKVNAFHNRKKGQPFFQKIPSGRLAVSWPGSFSWDLTIYEERSEPRWYL